jgi:hypothetical protein
MQTSRWPTGLRRVRGSGISPRSNFQIAATALRPLQLPEIAALRMRLVPEWPIYGLVGDGGGAEMVIDWKSDVDPNEKDRRFHGGQLEDYVRAMGAARGPLVYMTPGFVLHQQRPR